MLTKKQKEHKIKLICLIMIVNAEYARRKPFKNAWKAIEFVHEQITWKWELKKVKAQRTAESGGVEFKKGYKTPFTDVVFKTQNQCENLN